ncbi:MAG: NAD-dependent epimerase/dehydratase family protein [Bacillota bacterium]|nr:NAD-dependent epimerase/dehydratase family protein [Bacillota bacterium]
MDYLVGCTGFVGTNLSANHSFDGLFNSKNIKEAYGGNPDLLVYSGVPAEMFLANKDPEADMQIIYNAIENIKQINPKRMVLISTIAVYQQPKEIDEDTKIDIKGLFAYGANRRFLEQWVEDNFTDYLIVRLPALYGLNLKKNFIYDYINLIPAMLTDSKFQELSKLNGLINDYYILQSNGFWKCRELEPTEKAILKKYFIKIGFSALNFTDSRSKYQFYNLNGLWKHIEIALENGIRLFNPATEPVSVAELYFYLTGKEFKNELSKPPFDYDYRTKHNDIMGGENGYLLNKEQVLSDISSFVTKMLGGSY